MEIETDLTVIKKHKVSLVAMGLFSWMVNHANEKLQISCTKTVNELTKEGCHEYSAITYCTAWLELERAGFIRYQKEPPVCGFQINPAYLPKRPVY